MPSMNISHRAVEELIQIDTVPEGHQAWIVGGDPLIEVPTLSHQPNNREINDLIGIGGRSINDKLKPGSPIGIGLCFEGVAGKGTSKSHRGE